MRVDAGMEEEEPLSWKAVLEDTTVVASDGVEVGNVAEVLGAEQQDIFHGIVVRLGVLQRDVLVPADRITRITSQRIEVGLDGNSVRELPAYLPEESYHLGMVGLFRRHLGWVRDEPGQNQ